MSWPRILTLLLCFFLDVHVRAEVIEAPKGKRTMTAGKLVLNLDKGGLVEGQDNAWRLVRGQLLVESEESVHLNTPFVKATCEGSCTALFRRGSDHVVIQNLKGNWTYQPVGDAQTFALPVALQVRLGEVTPEGVAGRDFPQGLPWQSTLKAWAHLYSGGAEAFKHDAAELRVQWSNAIEAASALQLKAAQTQIDHHERELAAEKSAKASEERENEALRALFRAKNQLD